jgi:hypothetical protein
MMQTRVDNMLLEMIEQKKGGNMLLLKKKEGDIMSISPKKIDFITLDQPNNSITIVIGRRGVKLLGVDRPKELLMLHSGEYMYEKAFLIPNYDESL